MRYVSTRSTAPGKGFSDILLEGLAADGGLYLPETYPQVSTETLEQWRALLAEKGYAALAFEVVRLFVDDIPDEDLRGIVERAYAPEKFLDPAVVPVTRLSDGLWLAHLSNGPSAAFKDMAMQLLGELFAYELARRGETITIVGATSGDTGSSAEYALQGKPGVRVFMLSPRGRMTPFQQAQMFSIDDPAIVNLAVDGVFDDCQDLVKELNADADFKERHRVGAVNSINWARLMAQVVYYFAAWLQVSDGVTTIADYAFAGCSMVRKIALGHDVLVLADGILAAGLDGGGAREVDGARRHGVEFGLCHLQLQFVGHGAQYRRHLAQQAVGANGLGPGFHHVGYHQRMVIGTGHRHHKFLHERLFKAHEFHEAETRGVAERHFEEGAQGEELQHRNHGVGPDQQQGVQR